MVSRGVFTWIFYSTWINFVNSPDGGCWLLQFILAPVLFSGWMKHYRNIENTQSPTSYMLGFSPLPCCSTIDHIILWLTDWLFYRFSCNLSISLYQLQIYTMNWAAATGSRAPEVQKLLRRYFWWSWTIFMSLR